MNTETADAIVRRLNETRATAIWQYAPGWLGTGGGDLSRRLTGMALRASSGPMGSTGAGDLAGLEWGQGFDLAPRVEVVDPPGEVLGRYLDGNGISTARTRTGERTSVFIGDIRPEWPVIGRVLEGAGIHRWTRDGGITYTDGRVLFVHYGEPGIHTIHLPDNVVAREVGNAQGPQCDCIMAAFDAGQTRVYRVFSR